MITDIAVMASYTALDLARRLIEGYAIYRDITERKRREEELSHSFNQLRALTTRLEGIREEERKRVAREIHDELGRR
jgi:signal transduction histidine kinase